MRSQKYGVNGPCYWQFVASSRRIPQRAISDSANTM